MGKTIQYRKAGLFFGSFNPIHIGHLMIASYFVQFTALEEIWFVISPQNPFKEKSSLLNNHHRLQLVKTAIEDNPVFKASDIEFQLATPSYTVHTLAYLYEKYPRRDFALIMGSDNLASFHKWKNHEEILKHHDIYVYPRHNAGKSKYENHERVILTQAPMVEISSSFIRNSIKEGKDMNYFLPAGVYKYIEEMHFYER